MMGRVPKSRIFKKHLEEFPAEVAEVQPQVPRKTGIANAAEDAKCDSQGPRGGDQDQDTSSSTKSDPDHHGSVPTSKDRDQDSAGVEDVRGSPGPASTGEAIPDSRCDRSADQGLRTSDSQGRMVVSPIPGTPATGEQYSLGKGRGALPSEGVLDRPEAEVLAPLLRRRPEHLGPPAKRQRLGKEGRVQRREGQRKREEKSGKQGDGCVNAKEEADEEGPARPGEKLYRIAEQFWNGKLGTPE